MNVMRFICVWPLLMLNIPYNSLWNWTLMQAVVNREVKHWIQRCALQYGEDYSLNAATRSQWSQTMRNTYSGEIQQTVFKKYCKKSWRWAPLVQWWPTMQCSLNAANAAIIPPSPHYVPCLNCLRTPSCSLGSSAGSSCTGCFLHCASPKKLKYGKPRLGESTLTYIVPDTPNLA